MMTNALRRMGWIGILTAAVAVVPVRGEAPDAAGLVPADAAIFVGWSDVNDGKWKIMELARAVAYSPFLEQQMGQDVRTVRTLVELAEQVTRHPGAVYIPPPAAGAGALDQFGAVVAAGKDAAALSAAIRNLQMQASGNDALKQAAIDGVNFSTIAADGYLLWGTHKDHVLIASSEPVAKAMVACLNGGKSLKDDQGLAASRSKTGYKAQGTLITVYGDFGVLMRAMAAADSPADAAEFAQFSKALAIDAYKSFYLQFDQVEYGSQMTAYMRTEGPPRGLMKLYDQKPLTDDDLQVVPKDAYCASISNVDLNALWLEARKMIEQSGPENLQQVEGAVAMTRQYLGFSITEDLLPNLGDSYAFYDSPQHGGLLFTGFTLVLETKDPARFTEIIAAMFRALSGPASQANIRLTVQELKDGDHTVNYALVGGLPIPVAPAWGIVGNRVAIGLAPQTVAAALRQADPKTRGEGLMAAADFKEARALLPKSISSISYVDVRNSYRTWYALKLLVQTAAASMSVGTPQAYDLAAVPGYAADLTNERNMWSAYATDADGILYRGVGNSPATVFMGGDSTTMTTAMMVSILLPSLSRAREIAKRTVSASNLRGIGMACAIWANDNDGKFPPSLDELLKAGIVTEKQFMSPRDEAAGPNGPSSYVYISGQNSEKADPLNVLAYERILNDEGTNVLFVDGHVDWLKLPEFERYLRATYKQLGREGEFPAQLFPSADTDD